MDIEKKALELVNTISKERGGLTSFSLDRVFPENEALCRAIEQHEAFRREVSDAVQDYIDHYRQEGWLGFDHFIIPQPDPLHECLEEALARTGEDLTEHTERLRAALAARGLEIVKKEPSQ